MNNTEKAKLATVTDHGRAIEMLRLLCPDGGAGKCDCCGVRQATMRFLPPRSILCGACYEIELRG